MMKSKFINFLSALTLLVFLTACGDVEFGDQSSGWDAPRTQILSVSEGFADGNSRAQVRLRVYDRMGQPLTGLILRSFSVNNSIVFEKCDPSDASGVAICYFKSDTVGVQSTEIFDNFGRIAVDVPFVPPMLHQYKTKVGLSHRLNQSAGAGYRVVSEIKPIQGSRTISGGYSVNTQTVIND